MAGAVVHPRREEQLQAELQGTASILSPTIFLSKTIAMLTPLASGPILEEGYNVSPMMNTKAIVNLNTEPISWPRGGLKFVFGDIVFEAKKDKKHTDEVDYAVYLSVTSREYAKFLDKAAHIKHELPSCPRVRRIANSSESAALGMRSLWVLRPDWTESKIDSTQKIDWGDYVPGERIPRLGYNIFPENSFARFIYDCVMTLGSSDGLLQAHLKNGFINVNLGSFDLFYGFIFACHKAGKTTEECFELLPLSGARNQYPDNFDVDKIAFRDVQELYKLN